MFWNNKHVSESIFYVKDVCRNKYETPTSPKIHLIHKKQIGWEDCYIYETCTPGQDDWQDAYLFYEIYSS